MAKKKLKAGDSESLESSNRFSVLDQSLNFEIDDPAVIKKEDDPSSAVISELRRQVETLISMCSKLYSRVENNRTEINLLKRENKNLRQMIGETNGKVEKSNEICKTAENVAQHLEEKIKNVDEKIEKLQENTRSKVKKIVDHNNYEIWGTSKTSSVSFERPRMYSFTISKISNIEEYDETWVENELYKCFASHNLDATITECSRIPAFYPNCATKSFKIVLQTLDNVNELYNPQLWIAGTKITRFREKGTLIPGKFNVN